MHEVYVDRLAGVIAPLPPKLKQAMFAAAEKSLIKRGTWNGCAMNAASGEVLDKAYTGATTIAGIFKVDALKIQRFISVWDAIPRQGSPIQIHPNSVSDEEATEILKEALLKVGLHSEPTGQKKGGILRVEERVVYQSKLEELDNEFQALLEETDFNAPSAVESELVNDTWEVAELLSTAAAS